MKQHDTRDQSIDLALEGLKSLNGKVMVVADENWSEVRWARVSQTHKCKLLVLSNRCNVFDNASKAGIQSYFNDFDFSAALDNTFDYLIYRVSKERAATHHVINQAARILKPNASLILSGKKHDGIRLYIKRACGLFGYDTQPKKYGMAYMASIRLNTSSLRPLEDDNYSALRTLKSLDKGKYFSKPGIFGWDKIDRGSAFLIENLPNFLALNHKSPNNLLDLGCGYGYLACEAARYAFQHITATDNNAAALAACKKNFEKLLKVPNEVVASDAREHIDKCFEVILCNPPFHQGFSVDRDIEEQFLRCAKRLLAPTGTALFVVNKFIPIERNAEKHFNSVEVLSSNDSFKLVKLR